MNDQHFAYIYNIYMYIIKIIYFQVICSINKLILVCVLNTRKSYNSKACLSITKKSISKNIIITGIK